MNLHALFAATTDDEILRYACARHPDDPAGAAHGYATALTTLRRLVPDALSPGSLAIEVDDADTGWHEVYLIQPDGEHVSASMMSWSQWLAVGIPPTLRETYGDAVILGAVLWDMTFYGFDDATVAATVVGIHAALDRAVADTQRTTVPVHDLHKWLAAIRDVDVDADADKGEESR